MREGHCEKPSLSEKNLSATIDSSRRNVSNKNYLATKGEFLKNSKNEPLVCDEAIPAEFHDPFNDIPGSESILHRCDSHDDVRKTYCKQSVKGKTEVNAIREHSSESTLFTSVSEAETLGGKADCTADELTATGSEVVDLNDSVSTTSAVEEGALATGWILP